MHFGCKDGAKREERREKRTSSLASSTFLYGCMIPGSWTLTTLNYSDDGGLVSCLSLPVNISAMPIRLIEL